MCIICKSIDKGNMKDLIGREEIGCEDCDRLIGIPKELVNLKKLTCVNCWNLNFIPKEIIRLEELYVINSPYLQGIPKELVNLKKLTCVNCWRLTEIPKELVKLTELICKYCGNLKVIPKELVNLVVLYCQECPNLLRIPKEFTKLETLILQTCDLITHIPRAICVDNDNLKVFTVINNPSLTVIPYDENKPYAVKYDIHFHNNQNVIFAPVYSMRYMEDRKQVELNYQRYLQYSKEQCAKMVSTILEELIAKTWHPSRMVDWCWDEEEKKFMSGILC